MSTPTLGERLGSARVKGTGTYPLLRPEDVSAAAVFTSSLARLLRGPGQRLSERTLTVRFPIGSKKARLIIGHQVGMPPALFEAVLDFLGRQVRGADDLASLADLVDRYQEAYAHLYPAVPPTVLAFARDTLRHEAEERRLAEGDRESVGTEAIPGGVPGVGASARLRFERLSRLARVEAGRPVDTEAASATDLTSLGELYVERSIETRVRGRCRRRGVTVVRGEPGVGKTSLLWHLAETMDPASAAGKLPATGRQMCLFIRAVDLVAGRADAAAPGQIGLDDLGDVMGDVPVEVPVGPPAVLLVDTVDLLLRSEQGKAVLFDLLARVGEWPVSMVLTCRDQEYRELERVRQEFPHEAEGLDVYDSDELGPALDSHVHHFLAGVPVDRTLLRDRITRAASRGLPLSEIVRRPLTLRMLFETQKDLLVAAATAVDTRVGTGDLDDLDISDLYDRYWDLRVSDDRRVGAQAGQLEVDAAAAAELAAMIMLAGGRPSVDRGRDLDDEIGRVPAEAARDQFRAGKHALHDRRVLVSQLAGDGVEFFHQTFFEYAAARALSHAAPAVLDDLAARVRAYPHDLFLAAVVQQLLVHSCMSRLGAYRVDTFFAGLLASGDGAQEQLAVTAYALARHRGPQAVEAAGAVLARNAGLARRFMGFLPRARHVDMTSVLGDLAVIWRDHAHKDPRHASEPRREVLVALAACAAQDPDAVYQFLQTGTVDWLAWFDGLTSAEAGRVRGAPLALVEALSGTARQESTASSLVALATPLVRDTASRDGLADLLAVGARVLDLPDALSRVLALVPDSDVTDFSGVDALRRAIAGLLCRVWSVQDLTPMLLAERLCAEAIGWSGDPQRTRHQAEWSAFAELALTVDQTHAEQLMEFLLQPRESSVQTDIAERALPRLIEGPHRRALPGALVVDSPANPSAMCRVARGRCARALRDLPMPAKNAAGGRTLSALCRGAFDSARLPGRELAGVLDGAFPRGVPARLWSDSDGLAGLLAQAALGMHQGAREALADWVAGPVIDPAGRVAASAGTGIDNIVEHRLAAATERGEDSAWWPLLARAERTSGIGFVRRAVTHAGDTGLQLPADVVVAVASLAQRLVEDDDEHRRGRGYDLLGKVLMQPHAPAVPVGLVVKAVGERQANVVTKAITLVERVVASQPERLADPQVYADLEVALSKWTQPGGSATESVVQRAERALCDLVCRAGPLDPVRRGGTLDRARALSIRVNESGAPVASGHLVARLAAADPVAAAGELVRLSRAVHERPAGSWRARWARGMHRAVVAVVPRLSTDVWVDMVRALAGLDQTLLAEVVEVGAEHRADGDALVDDALASASVDRVVMERLRLVRAQRQRREGTATVWPEILARWRELAST